MLKLLETYKLNGTALCVIVAFICTIFSRYLIPGTFRLQYSESFLPLLVLAGYVFLFKKINNNLLKTLKGKRSLLVLSVFLTLFIQFGACIQGDSINVPWNDIAFFAGILINTLPVYAFLACIYKFLDDYAVRNSASSISSTKPTYRMRRYFILFAIFLISWTPILLAVWPGIFTYDVGDVGYGAWRQWITGEYSNHKSMLFTFLICPFLEIGQQLGSFNIGVTLYAIFQSVLLAGLFAWVIAYIESKQAPKWLVFSSVIYFALNPMVSIFAVSDCEDTLFAAAILLFMVLIYEAFDSNKMRHYICLVIVGFLVAALRPNGIYSLLLVLVVVPFVVLGKQKKTRLFTSVFCAALLFWIWTNPVGALLNVQNSALQQLNAFTQPVQQIAYTYNSNAFVDSEIRYLESLGWEKPSSYNCEIGDAARASMRNMTSVNRLRAWVFTFSHHPDKAIEGLLLQTGDAWNPYSFINYNVSNPEKTSEKATLFEVRYDPPASQETKIPWLYDLIVSISNSSLLQKIPLLSLLVCLPMYVVLFLLGFTRSIGYGRRRDFLALCIVIPVVGISLLGPAVIPRYYLCLIFALPFVAYLLFSSNSSTKVSDN